MRTWLAVLWLGAAAPAQGELFDDAIELLARGLHDRTLRAGLLARGAEFAPMARAARDEAEERAVLHGFLAGIPVSHLAVWSRATFAEMRDELANRPRPTLGMTLWRSGSRFWVGRLLEGGPAAEAGVRRGDRILAIDGVPPGASRRVDWRSDDAALDDLPSHRIAVAGGDRVRLRIERRPGERQDLLVVARDWSSFQAAEASARVFDLDQDRIAYVHLHYMHLDGVGRLLRELSAGELAGCTALVLDLRGRGGSAATVEEVVQVLDRRRGAFGGRVVALVDHATRSAKEVLAWRLQRSGRATIVGERTAGAVLPATFAEIGDDSVLMYPATSLGEASRALEGVGVTPDLAVADAGIHAAGVAPILDAALQWITGSAPARYD
jgi:carboxyl-terminal processing protease